MEESDYVDGNEFVFTVNENGQHIGGGFSIPQIMTKFGMSPIMTLDNSLQVGGGSEKVSDLFNNTAVPSWATMYRMHGGEYKEYERPEKKNKKKINVNKSDNVNADNSVNASVYESDSDSDSVIGDELHDKLLELAMEQENKIKKIKAKNTKKNKDREKKYKNTTKKQRTK